MEQPVNADVIIIGSGPAGSMSAYLLSRSGLNVSIIEKADIPRYKACGGALSLKSINSIPFDISPVIEQSVSGGFLTHNGKFMLKVDLDASGISMVMRDTFDQFLLNRAIEAGAHFIQAPLYRVETHNCHPVAVTGKGNYTARYLVGADGVNSRVSRSLGLLPHRQAGIALEAEITVPSSALQAQGAYGLFDFGALRFGYGWIFPKKSHLSVGVFQARPEKMPRITTVLEDFIARQNILQDCKMKNLRGHPIPLGNAHQAIHNGNVLLVGDAANLADPFLGEGIYYAVRSAQIATEELLTNFDDPSKGLHNYTKRVNQEIGKQFIHARFLANLVYRFPEIAARSMKKSPILQNLVFSVIIGKRTFQQINRRLIFRFPHIAGQILANKYLHTKG